MLYIFKNNVFNFYLEKNNSSEDRATQDTGRLR